MKKQYKTEVKNSITDYQSYAPKMEKIVLPYPGDPSIREGRFRMSKNIGLKFLSTLKDNNYTQTLNGLSTGKNAVCAVGVLALVMGFKLDGACYRKVAAEVGQSLVTKLFKLNDAEKLTLKQIGTWVENHVEFY